MMITNISDAKASLSKLIELVLQGQEVIIGKAGKPVATIVPYAADTAPRQLGAGNWKGKIWVADDFDDLPAGILSLFTGEADHESASTPPRGSVRPDVGGASAGREADISYAR